jgi:hypothetical protein
MLARVLPRRRMALLVAAISAVFIALAALAPTGAQAAIFSLKATSANAVVTSSCEFTATRFNENNTGPSTLTGRLTIKGAEIKPSFFSPRKVATLNVGCTVSGIDVPSRSISMTKTVNGNTVYKSRYVEIEFDSAYRVCVDAAYILRDGTLSSTPETCNPPASPE